MRTDGLGCVFDWRTSRQRSTKLSGGRKRKICIVKKKMRRGTASADACVRGMNGGKRNNAGARKMQGQRMIRRQKNVRGGLSQRAALKVQDDGISQGSRTRRRCEEDKAVNPVRLERPAECAVSVEQDGGLVGLVVALRRQHAARAVAPIFLLANVTPATEVHVLDRDRSGDCE